MTNLQVHDKNQGRGGYNSKGLIVRGGFSVLPHGLQEGPIGDEEDDERHKDAMEQADEKVLVVEQRPLLAGKVKSGEFQAQSVVDVLQKEEEVHDSSLQHRTDFHIHFHTRSEGKAGIFLSVYIYAQYNVPLFFGLQQFVVTWSRSPTRRTGMLL